jgi:membrane-bound ClpP family serine protease
MIPFLYPLLAAAADPLPAAVPAQSDPAVVLAWAVGFMLLGAGLLLVEFFVVSAGVLSFAAISCAGIAITLAFTVSQVAGFSFAAATPVLAGVVLWFGFDRLRRSSAVITADVGGRHLAAKVGSLVGATGTLITDAFPTGRARFARGEIDVQVKGAPLTRGSEVRVVGIDGPVVVVVAVPPADPPVST